LDALLLGVNVLEVSEFLGDLWRECVNEGRPKFHQNYFVEDCVAWHDTDNNFLIFSDYYSIECAPQAGEMRLDYTSNFLLARNTQNQ
jgi:hypothetical protein